MSVMWWCPTCERPLENDGTGRLTDTVTVELRQSMVVRHDGCVAKVALSGRSIARA